MKKVQKHRAITNELANIYEAKNHDYGDSFKEVRDKYPWAILVRLHDKLNRLDKLSKSEAKVDESIEDTLKDMANYCIMELIERGYSPSDTDLGVKVLSVPKPKIANDIINSTDVCNVCGVHTKTYLRNDGKKVCARCYNKEEDDLK